MKRLIVSTCGTSSVTNGTAKDLATLLRDQANDTEDTLDATPAGSTLRAHVEARRARLAAASEEQATELSAEIAVLAKLGIVKGDHHILLCSDTYQGREAAEGVADWIRAQGGTPEVRVLTSFSTRSVSDFHAGMARLAAFCTDEVPDWRQKGYRVVFNLIGGFKTMVAYASVFGMLYADEQVYLFEGAGSPLLTVPSLPLKMDARRALRDHQQTVRRLWAELPSDEGALAQLPSGMVERVGDEAVLSSLGALWWDQEREALYGERIWPSPDARIVLADSFIKDAAKLSADRLVQLNKRVDELARFVNSDGKTNVRSLNFKHLTQPQHGCAWEARAWSDEDASRLFCDRDGAAIHVRHLRGHL